MNKSIKVAVVVFNVLTQLKIVFNCKSISAVIFILILHWLNSSSENDDIKSQIAKDLVRCMISNGKKNIF